MIETHRIGGYVVVAVGVVMALSGAFLSRPLVAQVVNVALVAAVSVFFVSCRRRARARG